MRYRTKLVEIDAYEYGGSIDAARHIIDWARDSETPAFMDKAVADVPAELKINTLEGTHKVTIGDFVIKGLRGEFYPCKPDVFHKKYEAV